MPLPHDGEIVVVVVVVLPGVVVVVVPDPWTSAATSATKASTLASMPPASPPVVQDPRPSARENTDAKAGCFQIVMELRAMGVAQVGNRFDLNDDLAEADKIRLVDLN